MNVKNYLAPLVQKGAKNTIAITNGRFLTGRIKFPADVNEQAALSEVVATATEELSLLAKQVSMFESQKRGLMQRLLSGEWRVPVRDGDVDAMAAPVTQEAAQ